ncbi:hypothetical protein CFBP4996_27375 (plasmid) [Agrobacterium leguminum]|uniref:Uncharacterized protein n=1 Tax=Agrobacterium deltaense NCPPB 1641 TaxID=1183425 RepID=A0A1S7U8L9_9HYPH|nr:MULTISPECIES: hypothetical protein [Agrobacterium]WFS69983.1 hypothetical protein CFBP4996_27375 [Agrobacterium leguminum]CVI63145.1 conserved hypothetical protein [Agrobacterium deltaense NCPPB 1641]
MSEKSSAISSLPFTPVETWGGIHVAVAFEVLRDLYGLHAATLAAWCAIEARGDGDDDRYRFWFGLFCDLRKASPVYSLLLPPTFKINSDKSGDRSVVADLHTHADLNTLLNSRDVVNTIIRQVRSIVGN